jgi:hypothetical protein
LENVLETRIQLLNQRIAALQAEVERVASLPLDVFYQRSYFLGLRQAINGLTIAQCTLMPAMKERKN